MVIAPDAPTETRPPRPRSALFTFLGLIAVVLVVAGLTVGGFQLWETVRPDDTGGALDVGGGIGGGSSTTSSVPAPTVVRGTITAVHIEGAAYPQLAMPLDIVTPERGEGAGATFSAITVDGQPATIEWDAGRPLVLSGEGGGLLLGPGVVIDITAAGMVVTLDGAVHGFVPGTYAVDTPVAVGTAGIAEPLDRADFDAAESSTVSFRGGATATVAVPVTPDAILATGAVTIDGALTIVGAGETSATRVAVAGGASQLVFTIGADGTVTVEATLAGPVDVVS